MSNWEGKIRDNKLLFIGVLAGVAAVLAGVGAFYLGGDLQLAPEAESPRTAEAAVLATVNGEEITRDDVNTYRQFFAAQGQQMSEEEAVELAIDLQVLAQEAEKQGYSPTPEEVEEVLEVQLAQRGATIDDLKEELRLEGRSYEETLETFQSEVAVQLYVRDTVPLPEVNNSEAREFYEQNKEQLAVGGSVPSFEEVQGQITGFLQVEKHEEAISTLVQELRLGAEIVYY